jgi:acetyltransferase-like isoleucine patch superfamily enzyme
MMDKITKYEIGEWSYGKPRVISWGEGTTLTIGNFCSIAEGVVILLGGEHNTNWITTYPFNTLFEEANHISGHPKSKGNVTIGNDVWIGMDALILSGVTIGNGAVIAARSVVTRDVSAFSIVAGNPARFIQLRFQESIVNALNEICWWDWPMEKIQEAWPLLMSNQLDDFVARYGQK